MTRTAFLVSGLIGLCASVSHGEIVYSGVLDITVGANNNHDTTIAGYTYWWGIDSTFLWDAHVLPMSPGAGFFVTVEESDWVRNFGSGQSIGADSGVIADAIDYFGILHQYSGPGGGYFPAEGTGFVGIAMGEADNRWFGWMRFSLGNGSVLTLHDWAYESNLNQSIEAGAIPAPGAIAVAALAGLTGRRRRD